MWLRWEMHWNDSWRNSEWEIEPEPLRKKRAASKKREWERKEAVKCINILCTGERYFYYYLSLPRLMYVSTLSICCVVVFALPFPLHQSLLSYFTICLVLRHHHHFCSWSWNKRVFCWCVLLVVSWSKIQIHRRRKIITLFLLLLHQQTIFSLRTKHVTLGTFSFHAHTPEYPFFVSPVSWLLQALVQQIHTLCCSNFLFSF